MPHSTFKVVTHSPEETKELARRLASLLHAGDVISLTGDLGAGKTCFTQGLGEALGIKRRITSPTFNLIKEYKNTLPLYHFDLYRLDSPLEMLDLGYEEYFFGDGITVIEWGDKVVSLLPSNYLEISFKRLLDENVRELQIFPHGPRWEKAIKEWIKPEE
ncbi:MAG: tRNA (adenosine(37)-N6)-threonylcarbamoyltransferase complex ATPase subunit type 1 TsaE [Actinomycetota bacterium]|nr:tRNA (adenosine(37)-N6)-threonylcarbamoyltransferase complex ATPase subunit type 1 TsaE [Actinomycetota bacterium]